MLFNYFFIKLKFLDSDYEIQLTTEVANKHECIKQEYNNHHIPNIYNDLSVVKLVSLSSKSCFIGK